MTEVFNPAERSKRRSLKARNLGSVLFHSPWKDIFQFAGLIIIIVGLVSLSTARLGYNWQWYRMPRYLFRVEAGQTDRRRTH